MLSIQIPAEDMSEVAKIAELMATIKSCEVSTLHTWQIPCGSGIQLTIKLEGPVGFAMTPRYFDQAIRLLEVAKEGAEGWLGSTVIAMTEKPKPPDSEDL